MLFLPQNIFFKQRVKIFSIIILLKILYLRSIIFPQSTDLRILFMELASIVLIMGILELVRPKTLRLFWSANFFLSTYFMTTAIYYGYFCQFINFSAFKQIVLLKDLGSSIGDLFFLNYLIFYLDFILLLCGRLIYKVPGKSFPFTHILLIKKNSRHFIYKKSSPVFISKLMNKSFLKYLRSFPSTNSLKKPGALCLYQSKPVFITVILALSFSVLNIWAYPIKDNKMAMNRDLGMLTAHGYALFDNIHKCESTQMTDIQVSQAAINNLKQIEPISWPKYFGSATGKNIILVQLESTENFLIGLEVNGQEITPNLNRLINESMYFPHFFSQIGQGNTSDAEFITNTSLYPRKSGGVADDFIGIEYPSLPRLLKKEGYTSVTFHPNVITFWNRDNLYPCLGFDQYYDKAFYQDEDRIGPWGSSDEILYKKALPILTDFRDNNQKFYASLITLTNHYPFDIPENKKKLKLPAQLEGSLIGNYLTSVNYQDYAFGKFIESLKTSGLWDESIFIVFGDHYGLTKAMDTGHQDIFSLLLEREHDAVDRLNVPLIIRVPGLKPQIIKTLGGQVDILPTLTNLLGIPVNSQLIFGQDILNHDKNLLGFRFYHPDGTYITENFFYQAGSYQTQNIDNHKRGKANDYVINEEERIKSILLLADNYMQYLDENKKSGE